MTSLTSAATFPTSSAKGVKNTYSRNKNVLTDEDENLSFHDKHRRAEKGIS